MSRHRILTRLQALGLALALAVPTVSAAEAGGTLRPAAAPRKAAASHAPRKVETQKAATAVAAAASAAGVAAGVEAGKIHLAAVITPGIDPERRAAWFETLRAVVTQHNNNSNTVLRPAGGNSAPQPAWQLHVWELQGASTTWAAQLEAHWKKQPVLALASGLGTLWQPVDAFCQQRRVPCWFPSVDALPAQVGAHSLYFQAGVRLEAAVLARHLRELPAARRPAKLVQFYRNDALGHAAALALKETLSSTGIAVEYRALSTQQPEALDAAIAAEPAGAAWMLWLRGADLARLGALPLPAGATYFSGRMAGALSAVPPAWRERASVVYPYALDRKGAPAADEFVRWAQSRQLAVVDEGDAGRDLLQPADPGRGARRNPCRADAGSAARPRPQPARARRVAARGRIVRPAGRRGARRHRHGRAGAAARAHGRGPRRQPAHAAGPHVREHGAAEPLPAAGARARPPGGLARRLHRRLRCGRAGPGRTHGVDRPRRRNPERYDHGPPRDRSQPRATSRAANACCGAPLRLPPSSRGRPRRTKGTPWPPAHDGSSPTMRCPRPRWCATTAGACRWPAS